MTKLLRKIKRILFEPSHFFSSLKEKGVVNALVYLVLVGAVVMALSAVISIFFGNFSLKLVEMLGFPIMPGLYDLSTASIILNSISGFAIFVALSFVTAAILHVWLLIWGIKSEYSKTYQLYVYGNTPGFVTGWIPIVNWFGWIWSMIVLIIATMKMYKAERKTATWVYVLPAAIIIGIIIIGFLFILFAMAHLPPGTLESFSQA